MCHITARQVAEKIGQYHELQEFFENERGIRQEMVNELEHDARAAAAQVTLLEQVMTHDACVFAC